jgi:hypothetical protein
MGMAGGLRSFAEWADVSPVFRDPAADVMQRNHPSYDSSVMLTNTTGRNDVIESRVIHDANSVYFYVKTKNNMTAYTDPNWMLLLIDSDGRKETGWEGYDYVINHTVNSSSGTVVKKFQGNQWVNVGNAAYSLNGNQMEIGVSRSALGLASRTPGFLFKWADSIQNLNTIENFFLYGDVAPDRRFNFNYRMNTDQIFANGLERP